MTKSKVAIVVSRVISIIEMVIGLLYVFSFGFIIIMYLTDEELSSSTGVGFLIFCVIAEAFFIWLIRCSIKRAHLIKEFKRYVTVISAHSNGYISDIAASLGTPEHIVKANLERMMKKKYFSNAYIDYNTNRIVVINREATAQNPTQPSRANTPNTNSTQSTPSVSQTAEMITVKCKSCGGINEIRKGSVGECDFCGSSIKGE
ncbi:hypothetical protein [Flavonifractor hominis]|uniref:Uncharacterized protein n=1 Tax=Flavonifractor hominis TaxID=3133178 RepID=A0ABV1ER21_9FIRM